MIKPINLEALTKWVGQIPEDVVRDMADIAPMLSTLGYDPYANPPTYGEPDTIVAENTRDIEKNKDTWNMKVKQMLEVPNANVVDNGADKDSATDNPDVVT